MINFAGLAVTHWNHAMKVALAIIVMALLIICGIVLEYAITLHQISHSQEQWCDTLKLLTSDKIPYPSDPGKNPSRVETYDLYKDFTYLKSQFGCGS